jgi:nucleoside-diphosphate-sugar epimerase
MATILVTGGTGTLGHQVVSRLAVRRHRIRFLCHQTIPDLSEHVDMVNGDLFNVFKSGVNLVPAYAVGMITWEAFLHYHYSQKNVQ